MKFDSLLNFKQSQIGIDKVNTLCRGPAKAKQTLSFVSFAI